MPFFPSLIRAYTQVLGNNPGNRDKTDAISRILCLAAAPSFGVVAGKMKAIRQEGQY
jgi:hypothetical protein